MKVLGEGQFNNCFLLLRLSGGMMLENRLFIVVVENEGKNTVKITTEGERKNSRFIRLRR